MDARPDPNFPHRLDRNGIYHSICLSCFQTVATSFRQAMLIEAEKRHACSGPPPGAVAGRVSQYHVS
jgi:hypothetical protein